MLNSAVVSAVRYKGVVLNDGIKESLMENVLQIHTEAVSAQMAHFYEVCILLIALLGPVERQT